MIHTHRRALVRGCTGTLICLALALPSRAWAGCLAPEATLLWSYPDESTLSVPPDAVFWAVSHVGGISVAVDGVPLTSRGPGRVDRHQFVSAAPLTEGEHELLIQLVSSTSDADGELLDESTNEHRIQFRVATQPAPEAAVSIDSVTVYPLAWSNTTGNLVSPPPEEYDLGCWEQSIALEFSCNDLIPGYLARVGYAAQGSPVAYLVQGDTLVPAGCASFWTTGRPESDPATFRAAAVLSTGVAVEAPFAGPVEVRTLKETYPDRFGRPESCALGFGQSSPSALGVAGCLALAAWWARRRSP